MKRIPSARLIGLDTMVFIYHLEDVARYSSATDQIFGAIESGKTPAVTSFITLLEILVKPKREGKLKAASDYRDLLLTFPNLRFLPLDVGIADLASAIRARHGLRTPDAVQVATAISAGAAAFVTNDEEMKRVDEIEIILLSDLIK